MPKGPRYRHGMTDTKTHKIWVGMRRRCRDEMAPGYQRYGGRGIKVCDRWNESFEAFLEDMGECPEGLSIERIDYDGDYTPENCKWATIEEQNNNRRGVTLIPWGGRELSIRQWSRETGIPHYTLYARFKNGLRPPELFKPAWKKQMVVHDGVEMSVKEASDNLGVSIPAIMKRAAKGIPLDQSGKGSTLVEHNGQAMTLRAWARETGIKYGTLYRRYRSGKRGDELFSPDSYKTNKSIRTENV